MQVSTLTGSDSAYQVLSKYTNCGFSTMCEVVEGTHLLRVLNHGDCWGNNIMFHQKAVQSSETDIKLLDYQVLTCIDFAFRYGIDYCYSNCDII
jgi:hypothetical protein